MSTHPWFKFFAKEWLLSNFIRTASAEERGVYIQLLAEQWQNGGFLPTDDGSLYRLAACDDRGQWERVRSRILEQFSGRNEDGSEMWNAKLRELQRDAIELSKDRAEAGRVGNDIKKQKASKHNAIACDLRSQTSRDKDKDKDKDQTALPESDTPDCPNKNQSEDEPSFDGSEWALKTCKAYPLWKDPDALTVPRFVEDLYMETIQREAPARGGELAAAEWLLERVVQFGKQHKEAETEDRYIPSLKNFLSGGLYAQVAMPVIHQQKPEMTQEEAIALAQKRDEEAKVKKAAREAEIAERKRQQRGGL
jgi:uncharacterized protein YdaU (DUF1376 family)